MKLHFLKSAIYQFTLKNNRLPYDLSELAKPHPVNYISGLPRDNEGRYKVSNVKNGEGGWYYESMPTNINNKTKEEIILIVNGAVGFNYNVKECSKVCEFEPFKIVVSLKERELRLMMGEVVLLKVPVSIGKNNKTPLGEFYISEKVSNPLGKGESPKTYGTRGMVLSETEYAIHGTYQEELIGMEVSKGCIRMRNADIELLYGLTPLGTSVSIVDSFSDEGRVQGIFNSVEGGDGEDGMEYGLSEPNPDEILIEKIFGWLN